MNNNWNQPKTPLKPSKTHQEPLTSIEHQLHHLPQNNNIKTKLNSDLIKPWLNTTIKIH